MARLTAELVQKREAFLTKLFEKAKSQDAQNPLTLEKANEALRAEFSGKKGGGQMNAKKALEIRRKVYGSKVKTRRGRRTGESTASKPAATAAAATTATGNTGGPTQAARRGRPARITSNGTGLFVLSGTQEGLAEVLQIAHKMNIPVTVDEEGMKAVAYLGSHR